jgi:predicted transcriptional regulator
MGRPKTEGEKRGKTVSAKITETELAQLERIAQADERTLSYVVGKALREFLTRNAQHPHPRRAK